MATYCKTCLGEICDFCKWYDFNADEDGCYLGNGYCRLLKFHCDPDNGLVNDGDVHEITTSVL